VADFGFLGLAIYVIVLVIVYVFQARLIYFPTSVINATPSQLGLNYEIFSLPTDDGVTVSGWFVHGPSTERVMLFCHGNAGNMSDRLDTLRILVDLGYSVAIFDYRGYGQSSGKPTEMGTYKDAMRVWQYLSEVRGISPHDTVVFGRSLGAAVATKIAAVIKPRCLIVESGFGSLPAIASEKFWFLPVKMLCRFAYDNIRTIKAVRCPVLVIHSRDDRLISFRHGCRIFEAANEPKHFLEISGPHNDGFLTSGAVYIKGLRSFLTHY
jgi:fermentation-respiration switch protein FrsA (DUF1100 family)